MIRATAPRNRTSRGQSSSASDATKSAHTCSPSGALKTIEVLLIPVIGMGIPNQSCARQLHGPIVTTNAEHSTSSPSTTTA
eukprot:scaffold37403_cov33-Tisochrysis_lutea.AAC.2